MAFITVLDQNGTNLLFKEIEPFLIRLGVRCGKIGHQQTKQAREYDDGCHFLQSFHSHVYDV